MAGFDGPTGIPVKGYDGPEAERIRQERVFALLRERDPKLLAEVAQARQAARDAQRAWDVARNRLAGAVGNDGVHDVLSVIDSDMNAAEKRAMAESGASMADFQKNYRAPDYAYSEEEQRARKAAGTKK